MNELRKKSLAHYDNLLLCETPAQFLAEGWGWGSCILCRKFYIIMCGVCPVKKRTGEPFCRSTPYDEMEHAIKLAVLYYPDDSVISSTRLGPLRVKIRAMRTFLEGLDYE